jgi:hypothetical protein
LNCLWEVFIAAADRVLIADEIRVGDDDELLTGLNVDLLGFMEHARADLGTLGINQYGTFLLRTLFHGSANGLELLIL